VLDGGGRDPFTGRGNFGVVRPMKKHWESLLRCAQQNDHYIANNGIQQRDLSIFNNGTRPTCRPTCDAAFRQNSLTVCCCCDYYNECKC